MFFVLFCSGLVVFPVEPMGKLLEQSLRSRQRMWPNPPQFLDTIADAIRTQQVRLILLGWVLRWVLVEFECLCEVVVGGNLSCLGIRGENIAFIFIFVLCRIVFSYYSLIQFYMLLS